VDVRAAVEAKVVELVAKRADADLSAVRAVLERMEAEPRRRGGSLAAACTSESSC
jgi:DNA-binding GntR family transcriptional regulator